ncbi:substrate-binding domain-containing protein [Pontiella sp.]|uniref:AraC family transcriptional regulator n=1 Tax=Pontiella sp. TaxID=2837462 RepID=UPI00356649B1
MAPPKVAVLVDTSTSWGRRIVRGVFDFTAEHAPWDVLIEPKGQNEELHLAPDVEFDGIIARVSNPKLAQEIRERKIPAINISGLVIEGADFPRVTVDWAACAEMAENHFRDRAINNFAYVGPIHLAHVQMHEQVFEKLLEEHDSTCHIFQPKTNIDRTVPSTAWKEELIPWLESLPKPVGIYAWGFQVGRDIASACHHAGIPIPHDVAILGSDYDELFNEACHPALSGIISPSRKVGYLAARNLDLLMNGRKLKEKSTFVAPEEIEERLSTDTLAIDDPQFLQVLTYLRKHACENIHVNDILNKVPMGRRSLERRFMQILGRSPAQEIRRLRINQARRLLTQTNRTMEEIAEACGFPSYNYLGNVFKKETGISPGRYRSRSREL